MPYNPLNEPKPLDFQISKIQNDVEALTKEVSLLQQNTSNVLTQNQDEIQTLTQENKNLKKQALQTAEIDPLKVAAAERMKIKQATEIKQTFDQLQNQKITLQKKFLHLVDENPHVKQFLDSDSSQKRSGIDFGFGDVPGLVTIRDLETGVDEAKVRLREAKQIKQTYEKLIQRLKEEGQFYEERIKRQRSSLIQTTIEFENFTKVCDQAVVAAEQKQAEHNEITEYVQQDRDARKHQLEDHKLGVKHQLEKTALLEKQSQNQEQEQTIQIIQEQEESHFGLIQLLYYEKILSQHNFNSPTEFVNSCKNQAVVNDDLNDQEEVHLRIKRLNEELLSVQQEIQDCNYDVESSKALKKKLLEDVTSQITQYIADNNFNNELVKTQEFKIANIQDSIRNICNKLPLFVLSNEEQTAKYGVDMFTQNLDSQLEDALLHLREIAQPIENVTTNIDSVVKVCQFYQLVTLLRFISLDQTILQEAAPQLADNLLESQEINDANKDSEVKDLEKDSEAEKPTDTVPVPEDIIPAPQEDAYAEDNLDEDLYINLDDDEDFPANDLVYDENNIKIDFPRSRPSSKGPMHGRGKSGKAVVLNNVPQVLQETLDRKTMKQMSMNVVAANKIEKKEE
ncbi:hypothetical protein SS50377_27102 [Spironucleus salmonicida]|uniref:Uncharacterized protein n=2 Tax=Spironucleus salmonicida TaxID=348837 RepID=V6LGX7_9EUKA|nr:hypothetical protein SS50377_27102 [Spironucleus salmonicida]|eukprot:EST43772.1 Hypothetical protein SS50377_16512 [Spironucleus salmonicida]